MQIEEVIKIYEFLGNIAVWGFIGLCILLSIGIYAVFLPLKVKVSVSLIILTLVNISLIVLYHEAKSKIPSLHTANFIKQDLITSNFKLKSFNKIRLPGYTLGDIEKEQLLDNLVDEFPDEFLIVILDENAKNDLDRKAIALIDAKANEKIDKQINEKATLTAHLLVTFMSAHRADTVYMDSICRVKNITRPSLQRIDNDGWLIGQPFAKALIGKKDIQPIYDQKFNVIAFTVPKITAKQ